MAASCAGGAWSCGHAPNGGKKTCCIVVPGDDEKEGMRLHAAASRCPIALPEVMRVKWCCLSLRMRCVPTCERPFPFIGSPTLPHGPSALSDPPHVGTSSTARGKTLTHRVQSKGGSCGHPRGPLRMAGVVGVGGRPWSGPSRR